MEDYQKEFAMALAETGALFFGSGLRLKDGRPTPYFVNLGLFRTGRLSALIGTYLARMLLDRGMSDRFDVLLGPSYKGSALAVAAAQALWREGGRDVLFEYDRKEAKTHGEATGRGSLFVTNAFFPGARLMIVDDVGTTMGTKYELIDLVAAESEARGLDLSVVGVCLAVDREQSSAVHDEQGRLVEGVRGEDALAGFRERTGIPVLSLVGIRDVVGFLFDQKIPVLVDGEFRPLDEPTYASFVEYLETYGVAPVGTNR